MWGPVAVVSTPSLVLATSNAIADNFSWQNFVAAGVTPAAVLALLIFKKLYTPSTVDSYKERAEHAESQLVLMNTTMTERVVPALTLSTQVLDKLAPFLQSEITFRAERGRRSQDRDD